MKLGGFQRFSMLDYPDKICAIGFTQGCNFRCPYCHNPELVEPEQFNDSLSEEKVLSFLDGRRDQLDAVTITGGEPTIHSDLPEFIKKIKDRGFLVKLDTNGTNPKVLRQIISDKTADYIAMDIKAPIHKYSEVARMPVDLYAVQESIGLIMKSNISYEFRTTVVSSLLNKEDLLKIGELIRGAELYALQKFLPTKTIDVNFLQEDTYSDEELEDLKVKLLGLVKRCIIR